MVFSFSSEKLIERGYDRLSGISLPGGRALWYPEWLFVGISVALTVLMAIVGSLGLLMLMIGAADAASALMCWPLSILYASPSGLRPTCDKAGPVRCRRLRAHDSPIKILLPPTR